MTFTSVVGGGYRALINFEGLKNPVSSQNFDNKLEFNLKDFQREKKRNVRKKQNLILSQILFLIPYKTFSQ